MPRAALFLLLALAGPAHAALAAAPVAGGDPVAANPATDHEAETPARSGPAALPPGEGQAGSGRAPADPAAGSQALPVPSGGNPPAPADAPATPSTAGAGGAGARAPGAAPARPQEDGAAPAAGSASSAPPSLPLPPSTAHLAVSGVLGRTVDGPDGQDIGRVVDVLVDGSGHPRAAVIDFGGFMGLGSRKIAVEWSAFSFPPGGSDAVLRIVLSPEQIKDTPEYAGPGKPVAVVGPGTPVPGPGP